MTKRPAAEPGASLDELVAQTEGPQPWRKAFHAFNAVVIAFALEFVAPSRGIAIAALFTVT